MKACLTLEILLIVDEQLFNNGGGTRSSRVIASPSVAGPLLEALMLRLATPTAPFATCDRPARGTDPPALRLSSPRPRWCSAPRTPRSLARGTASRVGEARQAASRIGTARPCPL